MANGIMLPDIGGQFYAGRDRLQRNKLLERSISQEDEALAREEQTRNLLAEATMPGASPEERAQNLNKLMAVNPQAAMQAQGFQQQNTLFDQGQDEVQRLERQRDALRKYRQAEYILNAKNPSTALTLLDADGSLQAFAAEQGWIDPDDGISDDEARKLAEWAMQAAGPEAGVGVNDMRMQGPASMQTFSALTEGLSPEEVDRARKIELGLEPRAAGGGQKTFQSRGADGRERVYRFNPQTGVLDTFTGSQWVPASGGASPYGGAESPTSVEGLFVGRSPEEQTRLTEEAKADVKAGAAIEGEQRANARTLDVWRTARAGLMEGLAGTNTGPVAGRMPAVTSGQQVASGAVAAVAPVLKQLFRSAGEGIFTDKDQELLMDMVPTRTDHPETIAAKMANIDAIIEAKLGRATEAGSDPELPDGVTEEDIEFTMQKHGLTRKQVLERLNAS